MKKLIFGFVATLMLSTISFGQAASDASKKAIINAQMVTLVNTSRTFYVKGQTYDDFVKAMMIPSPTVPSQDDLFRKVFGYLSSNTPDCDILKSDNSIFTKFTQDLANSTRNHGTMDSVFSEKKKWWQHLINHLLNLAETLLVGPVHDPVDLWPEEK